MWAVAVVNGNMEMRCLNTLRNAGIEALVPLGRRLTRPGGTRGKKKLVTTTYILFPGYVFVNIPDDFNFMKLKNSKIIAFLFSKEENDEVKISKLSEKTVEDLRSRHDVNDLFHDYEKKDLRKSFNKNQLVCWRANGNYVLGFISKSTRGKQYAYVKIAGNEELKIHVASLSLL